MMKKYLLIFLLLPVLLRSEPFGRRMIFRQIDDTSSVSKTFEDLYYMSGRRFAGNGHSLDQFVMSFINMADVADTLEDHNTRINVNTNTNNTQDDTLDAHNDRIGRATDAIAVNEDTLADLRTDLNVATNTNNTQDDTLGNIRTDLNVATNTNNTQDDSLANIRTDTNTNTNLNNAQDDSLGNIRTDLNTATNLNADQSDSLSDLRTDLNTATNLNIAQDDSLADLRTDINTNTNTNATQEDTLSDLRTDINTNYQAIIDTSTAIRGDAAMKANDEVITGNFDFTAHPMADNEVENDITITSTKKISTTDSIHTDLGLKIRNLDLYYGGMNRLRTSNSLIVDDSLFVGTVSTLDRIGLNGTVGIGGALTMRGGDIQMNEYGISNATAIKSTQYGSNNSISDAELLGIDDGTTAQIPVGGGAGSAMVWTTATGTGAPVRAGSPTFTGTLTAPKVKATTGTKAGYADLKNQTTAPSGVGIDSLRIQGFDDGSNIHIAVTTDDNTTETTRYLASKQDVINGDVGTSLWFITDDYVEVADDPDIDVGTGDFSIRIIGLIPNNVTATEYLINKEAGGIGYGLYKVQDDLYIRFDDGTTDVSAIIGTAVFTVDTKYNIFVNFDRDGNATAFIFGGQVEGQVGTVAISTAALTLSNAGALRVGCTTAGASFFAGEIEGWDVFNTLISTTSEEGKRIIDGGAIPNKYIGASQTELITASDDRDFTVAGNVNWTGASLGTFDVTGGNMHCIANSTWDGIELAKTEIGTLIEGKSYRAIYDISIATGSWNCKFGGVTVKTGISAGTNQSIEFIPTAAQITNGVLVFQTPDSDGEGTFDNFSLIQIGCVAQYEPSGINSATWVEPNGRNGTISGATVVNPLVGVYTLGNVEGATYTSDGSVTDAELKFVDATSSIQTQLDALGGGVLNADLTVDSSYSVVSMIYDTVGAVIYVGDFVYSPADGDYELASASASTTFPCTGLICRSAGIDKPTYILQEGYIRLNSWTWTKTGGVGDLLYLSTTAGDATQTAPSSTDEYIQIIGRVIGPDVIYFNPSMNWVKHE